MFFSLERAGGNTRWPGRFGAARVGAAEAPGGADQFDLSLHRDIL